MAHAVEQVAEEIREISHVLLKDRCSIEFKYRYVKSDKSRYIQLADVHSLLKVTEIGEILN